MKVFVVLLSVFFVVKAELDKEFINSFVSKVKSVGEVCVPEVSASKADIDSLLEHKVPESHEGKCLIFCFHTHFHIQNEDGSLDKAGALQAIEPLKAQDADIYDKVLTVFKACEETTVDGDPCVYAANLAECAVKEGTKLNLNALVLEMNF